MVKRFISSNASEILSMTAPELKQSIKASEGRVILSENVAFKESYIGDVTNAEIARSFGADLILLNGIDIFQPFVAGLDAKEDFVKELHRLVGRPIGYQSRAGGQSGPDGRRTPNHRCRGVRLV